VSRAGVLSINSQCAGFEVKFKADNMMTVISLHNANYAQYKFILWNKQKRQSRRSTEWHYLISMVTDLPDFPPARSSRSAISVF